MTGGIRCPPLAVRRVTNTLVTSFALYQHNWLQKGLGRFADTCSANQVTVVLHKFPAEGVNGEGFQHLFFFLIVSCA